MSTPTLIQASTKLACISLIGMAGAGKSTVAQALAQHISWALVDTDHIIEASYGTMLQNIANAITKDEFLDTESHCIKHLSLNRTVIATGGSVVYREEAMENLATLGPIVHIKVDLPLILERIARNPNRGLAIAEGQTVEDLFYEREALYQKYAHYTLQADSLSPMECASEIMKFLPQDILFSEVKRNVNR